MKKLFPVLFIFLIMSFTVYSQVEDKLSLLKESDVKNYAQPLATSVGAALNSGSFHDAYVPKLFGFYIGLKGMLIFVPDDELTFTPNLPAGFSSATPTATIFGGKGTVYSNSQASIVYPDGLDAKTLPLVFPQAAASLLGTEVMIRFLPTLKIDETEVNLFGIGVRHNFSSYIPLLPIDLAVQVLYNKLDVESVVKASSFAFSVQASKSLANFTAYGALQYEFSEIDAEYTIKADPSSGDPELRISRKIKVTLEGDNKFRLVLGGALRFTFFVLNADYSIGSQSVFSSGISFQF